MPPREWLRAHATGIVAALSEDDVGRWLASAHRESDHGYATVFEPFTHLWSAQVAADELARTTFDHICTAECGEWRFGR